MPHHCGRAGCRKTVEPVAVEFRTERHHGWFIVCPICHYVFGRVDDPPANPQG